MRKTHRKVHAIVWLILLPTLLGFLYLAQQNTAQPAPQIEQAPSPSLLGDLP